MDKTDFLIIGGGIVGVSIARELRRRFGDSRVMVLEKEARCGQHASGRNSGVLHAGFYYYPDSLKAKFTRDGNRRLTEYCERKALRINKCGKLVVAKDASELASLDELYRRGNINNVPLTMLTEDQAKAIEPRVKTYERALFSPSTASVDPQEVTASIFEDAAEEGVRIITGSPYLGRAGVRIKTAHTEISAGYVVNAAGLYADKVARDFGFSQNYRILPFKGLYLYSDEPPGSVKVHIYPVPDLRNPFLGVHYTLTVDGKIKIGPTAIPAFWREQYAGFSNFRWEELGEIAVRQAGLLAFSNFDFKTLAVNEIRKYSRARMVKDAARLLEGADVSSYTRWGKPGIRAQLLDLTKRKLEMDFVVEGDDRSFHVLNAVSPAFTCALPFSDYVCDQIQARLK